MNKQWFPTNGGMEKAAVLALERPEYLRWVRFYLDFCQKYGHPPREETSIPRFLEKLASKKQPEAARGQASKAIYLLLERKERPAPAPAEAAGNTNHPERAFEVPMREAPPKPRSLPIRHVFSPDRVSERREPAPSVSRQSAIEKAPGGASWEQEYRDLAGAIKLRNYSESTHEAYRMWVQRFQAFARSKPPGELDDEDVKGFLTDLAVRQEVAGSAQSQVFNALLFSRAIS